MRTPCVKYFWSYIILILRRTIEFTFIGVYELLLLVEGGNLVLKDWFINLTTEAAIGKQVSEHMSFSDMSTVLRKQ